MAWRSSGQTNEELIENLFKNGQIGDEKVRDAMLKVDRAHYSPTTPYADTPQPLGHRATISAPHMHALAASSLLPFLYPGARVLDIGSGSGYLTAVLAELVCADDEGGRVVGLEHIQELRDLGERNMRRCERGGGLIEVGRVVFVKGDGRRGWRDGEGEEGWDAIHVGAAAKEVHGELVEQLKSPGRIFIPVEEQSTGYQYIWVIDKNKEGVVSREKLMGVNYVPLTDAYKD